MGAASGVAGVAAGGHERSMNGSDSKTLTLGAATLAALPERALWCAGAGLLVVSDLHLGKAERMARRTGALVPPYEAEETVARLGCLVDRLAPRIVVCLGDSFDDLQAARALPESVTLALAGLMAGRRWIWVLGNHDPGPVALGGECMAEFRPGGAMAGIVLRHIAAREAEAPEISGHYHPKARLRGVRRPAFVTDGRRLILPAFGTYTGGLDVTDPAIAGLMGAGARALLAGPTMAALPLAALGPAPYGPPRAWRLG